MKVKIYVNETLYETSDIGLELPKVLTEKTYKEFIERCVQERLKKENLMEDDGFADWLGCDYTLSKVFFLNKEEKEEIIKDFNSYVREDACYELKRYYVEYEIEI